MDNHETMWLSVIMDVQMDYGLYWYLCKFNIGGPLKFFKGNACI